MLKISGNTWYRKNYSSNCEDEHLIPYVYFEFTEHYYPRPTICDVCNGGGFSVVGNVDGKS